MDLIMKRIQDFANWRYSAVSLGFFAAFATLLPSAAKAAVRTYSFSNVSYTYTATSGGNCTNNTTCTGSLSGYFVWDSSKSMEGVGSFTFSKSSNSSNNSARTYTNWAVDGVYLDLWNANDSARLELVTGLSSNDQRYLQFKGGSTNDGFSTNGCNNTTGIAFGSTCTFSLTSNNFNLNSGSTFNIAPNPTPALGVLPFLILMPARIRSILQKRNPKLV